MKQGWVLSWHQDSGQCIHTLCSCQWQGPKPAQSPAHQCHWKINGLSTLFLSFTSCTHLWCSLHAWEGHCSFWLLQSSPCLPVLFSLLLEHVEAVGINTGKCRASWQKENLTSCASTLGYGVWFIQLKPRKEVWKDTAQKIKLTSCHTYSWNLLSEIEVPRLCYFPCKMTVLNGPLFRKF